ncbi:hypothetical protein WJX74_007800 [Apatococcus lobatus]|uniref:Transcription initiation factor TFIID subunit 8 n=1 Tax=Apatococcus lobatus TaxID=904363 RepID=A0AAW1QC21_9CHLO
MAEGHSRAIARTAVAMLAEGAGFQEVQKSALEAMTDLLLQQLGELGGASHGHANLAGRTDCNINDVLMAFDDLGISTQELQEYAEAGADSPFLHNIAPFPIQKQPKALPSFADKKEEPPAHILPGMPAFPDPHTYKSTPVFEGHDTDARRQKLAATKAKTQAEKALVKLNERMMPPPPTPSQNVPQPTPGRLPTPALAPGNPFLAAPRWEDGTSVPTDWENDLGSAEPISTARPGPLLDQEMLEAAPSTPGEETSQWHAAEAVSGESKPESMRIPGFQLDWAARLRDEAAASVSVLGFEDAYEEADDGPLMEGQATRGRGRRRRGSAKASMARRKLAKKGPQTDLTEAILAAGSNALHLHDKPQGPPAADTLQPPASHGGNQPQQPASEIF